MEYAKILTPVKYREELTYLVPEGMQLSEGQWVRICVGRQECVGVVKEITSGQPQIETSKMKEVTEKVALPPVTKLQMDFWRNLADYYMCSISEVVKAACPASLQKQAQVRPRKKKAAETSAVATLPELSPAQKTALDGIRAAFAEGKNVLLHGVTGSGKTEIYMHAASELLEKGRTVLFMVPEIAISQQLQERLGKVFGERLLVHHSRQTAASRKRVYDSLSGDAGPFVILGTRSSIFLPFRDLSLVIVDEEHDASYKQDEPAPRYNGRDAAMLLASMLGAKVLLGSATPSLESLYNVKNGKLRLVELTEKYFEGACESDVVIIDTIRARRNKDMDGAFSKHLLREMEKAVQGGGQVLVFRSRRAYSTMVQCSSCGDVPSCPKCGVPLTYHKFKEALECHYCGYRRKFTSSCPKCGAPDAMLPVGAGTERLEEELSEHFPTFRIERFDSDTTQSKVQSDKILKEFADGKIDILVGTQMITKGFDFENLSLVAVVAADSLLALQDFRADERALQMLRQVRGRAGRRDRKGMMFIQTSQPKHPVFQRLAADNQNRLTDDALCRTGNGEVGCRAGSLNVIGGAEGSWTGDGSKSCGMSGAGRGGDVISGSYVAGGGEDAWVSAALAERKAFGFPPFSRLVLLTVSDRSEGELWHVCREICEILDKCGVKNYDKVEGEKETQFWIKLPRTAAALRIKKELRLRLEALELRFKRKPRLITDADPL